MPPKLKLHKTTPRASNGPPNLQNSNQPSTSNMISITPEQEMQFETELCWCIEQLQTALKSGKLSNKQVQDHTKTLNTLMSNSSPMIKKRQVMRMSFGDYRVKMAVEDKKKSRNAVNMKVKPATPSKKSVFIKKSSFASSSGNTFRFNFKSTEDSHVSNEVSSNIVESEDLNNKNNSKAVVNKFVPSDNSFRFKFNINEEL